MVWAGPFFDNLKFLSTLPPPCLQPPCLKHYWYFGKSGGLRNKLLADILSSICLTQKYVDGSALPTLLLGTYWVLPCNPELHVVRGALAALRVPLQGPPTLTEANRCWRTIASAVVPSTTSAAVWSPSPFA